MPKHEGVGGGTRRCGVSSERQREALADDVFPVLREGEAGAPTGRRRYPKRREVQAEVGSPVAAVTVPEVKGRQLDRVLVASALPAHAAVVCPRSVAPPLLHEVATEGPRNRAAATAADLSRAGLQLDQPLPRRLAFERDFLNGERALVVRLRQVTPRCIGAFALTRGGSHERCGHEDYGDSPHLCSNTRAERPALRRGGWDPL